MLPVDLSTIRLFIHVLAATVWVGGQLTLAGLVPGLRAAGPDVPRAAARAFNRIAWPAYGVLVLTGIWNILDVDATFEGDYGATLMAKITIVLASGVSAGIHAASTSKKALAIWGGLSGLTALGALFLGIVLRQG